MSQYSPLSKCFYKAFVNCLVIHMRVKEKISRRFFPTNRIFRYLHGRGDVEGVTTRVYRVIFEIERVLCSIIHGDFEHHATCSSMDSGLLYRDPYIFIESSKKCVSFI